ncbi:MAG: cell wall-binding repeat-containing protein, partial [Erysipelotrichaceae bacterium]|nr:cell wall-binding repeat-containing protein [Erysipelotrichaceae bacterium]
YIVGVINGTFTINKRSITVKADDLSKTYGEEDPKLTATVTGAVEGDTVSYTLSREEGEDAGEYKISVTAGENPNYEVTVVDGVFTIKPEEAPAYNVIRLSGKDRYATSIKAADELKSLLGVDKFDAVILATGKNFADALAGGYLAAKKSAPILLTSDKKAAEINEYINKNLKDGGTVYILGGEAAVSDAALAGLNNSFDQQRLAGKDRYATNLLILETAGITNESILICTGAGEKGYADSLSASSTGLPMLLVNGKKDSLTDAQKNFLTSHSVNDFYIIGGTGAVSEGIGNDVNAIHSAERLSGKARQETSALIAKTFYPNAEKAVIAYSDNYPDGLCAGPLGYTLKAPILLVKDGKEAAAAEYCAEHSITSGYIAGGTGAVSDVAARIVFSLPEDVEIVKK